MKDRISFGRPEMKAALFACARGTSSSPFNPGVAVKPALTAFTQRLHSQTSCGH